MYLNLYRQPTLHHEQSRKKMQPKHKVVTKYRPRYKSHRSNQLREASSSCEIREYINSFSFLSKTGSINDRY